MINIIGYIIVSIMLIIDYLIIKSTIQTYKHMKEAKKKAKFWRAI